jgi:hypothetical protein
MPLPIRNINGRLHKREPHQYPNSNPLSMQRSPPPVAGVYDRRVFSRPPGGGGRYVPLLCVMMWYERENQVEGK